MKKVLVVCLMMVMVLSMSVTAFADPDGFVVSPSKNPAPTIIEIVPDDDACTAQLVITPYAARDTLSAELKALIERAYNEIRSTGDLTKLSDELAAIAKDKNVNGTDLAVSDLFDLHIDGCLDHEDHVGNKVVLKADTLKNFVGLLHMTTDGQWELIENAKITENGKQIEFHVDSFSPFAVVVNNGEGAPDTGDNSRIYIYTATMALSGLAVVAIVLKTRKQKI
jgi:hypothetical protein